MNGQASNARLNYASFSGSNETSSSNTLSQNTPANALTTSATTSTSTTTTIPQANLYAITFNTIPATGSIVFNSNTYTNGNTIQVAAGSYNANAIAPANFTFSDWSYTGNLTVASPTEPNAIFSVSGNGIITATFNALTTSTSSTSTIVSTVPPTTSNTNSNQQTANTINMQTVNFSISPTTGKLVLNTTITGPKVELNSKTGVVRSLVVALKSNGISVGITLTNQSALPQQLPELPKPYYEYIHVNGTVIKGPTGVAASAVSGFPKENDIDAYIANVTYNFIVPASWLEKYNISPGSVVLFKYFGNTSQWKVLPTELTGSNGIDYSYSALSDSFSSYVVGFTTNSSTSTTGRSLSLNVVGKYRTYLWAGAGLTEATGGPMSVLTCGTWSINATAIVHSELCAPSAMTPMANVTVIANSTSHVGTFTGDSDTGGADNYTVLAGIGANVIMAYKAFETTTNTSDSLSFTTTAANSVVFLLFGTSGFDSEISSLTLPTGCKQQVLTTVASTDGSAAIANCSIATAGTYTASATWAGTTTLDVISSAAIGFAPYSVTFDSSPSSGTITAEGQTYTNGESNNIIGTGTITANPPTGYKFAKWLASNSNITFGSNTSGSTTFTVEGNGIITAVSFEPAPVSVTFNDSPTTGYMVVNGTKRTNGAVGTLTTGTQYTANAVAPSGFNFARWVFYPSANATISNSISANTSIIIYGTGTLKAFFSPPGIDLGVPLTTSSTTSTTGSSLSLNVGGNYRTYLWGGSGLNIDQNGPMSTLTCGTWSINATAIVHSELCAPSAMTPMANVTVIANSTSHVGTFTGDSDIGGDTYNYSVLAGMGANVLMANKAFEATTKTSPSINFTTTAANSVVFLLFGTSGTGSEISSLTLPTGCKQQVLTTVTVNGSDAIANCSIATAGTYTASATWAGTTTLDVISSAAIGFAPYGVTLDDSPSGGTISVAGSTYSSGIIAPIIGTGTITANPPTTGNWSFGSWSTSNSNLTVLSDTSNPTGLTVMGSGVITATWNGLAKFIESGLPSATTWNVIYDSILNSSSTNTILFSVAPGTYSFSVANQVVNGATYIPTPSTGTLYSTNAIAINFVSTTSTTTTTTTSTSTTSTSTTSTTSTSTTSTSTTSSVTTTIYSNEYVTYANEISSSNSSLDLPPGYKTYFYQIALGTSDLINYNLNAKINWTTIENYTTTYTIQFTLAEPSKFMPVRASTFADYSKELQFLTSQVTYYFNYTNIGDSTEHVGTATEGFTSGESRYTSLSGIGIDLLPQNGQLFDTSGPSSTSPTLSFTVSKNNSFAILMYSAAYNRSFSITYPAGCSLIDNVSDSTGIGTTAISLCRLNAGSYSTSMHPKTNDTYSMVSYVFPPYSVTFNDNPTSGSIKLNGTQYSSGSTEELLGSYNITAVAPSGYSFSNWSVSNSINLTVTNPTSSVTTLIVAGNGIVTANYKTTVTETCTISLSANSISFGTLDANASVATDYDVTDTNLGNNAAYMLVYGGNWIGTGTFGVSNTLWSPLEGIPFTTANGLELTPVNTSITVPASTSNSIYFGLKVPGGARPGPYTQNIIIENSC
ncbi:MAG: PGF-pre-PGF domain-containing protein [Candidatus Marsarchaeota archaeon]|nr:PGF-pre-PGF domain-containing protein [Candidatus Marsarchaeota archaeon]